MQDLGATMTETKTTDESSGLTADQKLIATALKRFQRVVDAESENRGRALNDLRFAAGDQWDASIRAQRQVQSRPCLTINRTLPFIRQVTNEQRQNRPAIRVLPVDSKADPETAEILNGIIRHIEAASGAETAYDTAFEAAVTAGWGYFRILTEYTDERSFDQDIRIKRIINPFTVYLDSDTNEADRSDAKFGFIVEDIRREDFEQQYPDADPVSFEDNAGVGDDMGWSDSDTVRIAEYFYIEDEAVKLYQLADGSVVEKLPEGVKARAERSALVPRVKWCKITSKDVLDKRDWAGKYIPIVFVSGDETHFDGKHKYSGLTTILRDPQQAYNFFYTATAETVALTPKAPYIMAEGQDEGYEQMWAAANVETRSALIYRPVTLNGSLAPPPQRQQPGSVPPGLMALMEVAAQDMKVVSGIYDASLGARSNETSGRAINARKMQSQIATFQYMDNLTRAIRFAGRIIVDLIPKVLDSARLARILGADGEPETVPVNQAFDDNGIQRIYDLGLGTYDVVVTAGPSYASRREEAAQTMAQLAQADPSLMQKAGDLIVKNMDFPGADDLAKRLKLFLPPEAQDEEGADAIPPQALAQLKQQEQAIQQLSQALEQAHSEVEAKDDTAKQASMDLQMQTQALKFREDTLKLREQVAQMEADFQSQSLKSEKAVVDAQLKYAVEKARSDLESLQLQAEALAPMPGPAPAVDDGSLQAIAEMIQAIAEQQQSILIAVTAPNRVLPDDSGLVVGVETVPTEPQF